MSTLAVQMVCPESGEILQFLTHGFDRASRQVEHFSAAEYGEVFASPYATWHVTIIEITTERNWQEIDASLRKSYESADWSDR